MPPLRLLRIFLFAWIVAVGFATFGWRMPAQAQASDSVTCPFHTSLSLHTRLEFRNTGHTQCFNIQRSGTDYQLIGRFKAVDGRYRLYWTSGFNVQQMGQTERFPYTFQPSSAEQPFGLPAFGGGDRYTLAVEPLDPQSPHGFDIYVSEGRDSSRDAERDSDTAGSGGLTIIPGPGSLFDLGAGGWATYPIDATCTGRIKVNALWNASESYPMIVRLVAPNGDTVREVRGSNVEMSYTIQRADLLAGRRWYVIIGNPGQYDISVADVQIDHPGAGCALPTSGSAESSSSKPYGLVCLINETDWVINYTFRWGEREWQSGKVDTHNSWLHWWTYEAGSRSSPTFEIRFDADFSSGTNYKNYDLKRYQAAGTSCWQGKVYKFERTSGNAIELFDAGN